MMPMTLMQLHTEANWLHGNNTMLVHYFPIPMVNFWWHRLTLTLTRTLTRTLTLPAITSSPLMLNFRILSRPHHPSSLWTPARLRLLFAIQPRIL